jgi:hypothetical protein
MNAWRVYQGYHNSIRITTGIITMNEKPIQLTSLPTAFSELT